MPTDPKDDLIDQLVEHYKGTYLAYQIWQQVASEGWQGKIPAPVLEKAKQRLLPPSVELFAEYDQARAKGVSAGDALRSLLVKLRQSIH